MTEGAWRPDRRLAAYLFSGFAAMVVAIAMGRYELAAVGTPFVALAALGLANRQDPQVRAEMSLSSERVIENDVVEGSVELDWDGEAELDVLLDGWRGVAPIDPSPAVGWSLPLQSGPVSLPFQLRAESWGRHELGKLWVRVRRRDGLLVWEQEVLAAPSLRILPTPLRLDRLLKPAEPHAIAGMHLSRLRGSGTDFAELRPYAPGDRMRDLSWSTTARLGAPWVIVHHPERTGTVLLLLDASLAESDGETKTEALARAARAAWAVASVHLRAQDRVGLQAEGRATAWLAPQGGRRARWMLLDELLSVGTTAETRWMVRRSSRPRVMPTDALIVGITSLHSWRFREQLLHYRRAGHTTVALVVDTSDMLPPVHNRMDEAAERLWLAEREATRYSLEQGGIPTAVLGEGGAGVGAAISTLRRRSREQHRAGARAR